MSAKGSKLITCGNAKTSSWMLNGFRAAKAPGTATAARSKSGANRLMTACFHLFPLLRGYASS